MAVAHVRASVLLRANERNKNGGHVFAGRIKRNSGGGNVLKLESCDEKLDRAMTTAKWFLQPILSFQNGLA